MVDLFGGDACNVVLSEGVLHLPAGALPLAAFKGLAVWLVTPCGLLGEEGTVEQPCGDGAGKQQGSAGQPFKPKRRTNSWATLLMAVSSQMAARAAKVGRMGVGCR